MGEYGYLKKTNVPGKHVCIFNHTNRKVGSNYCKNNKGFCYKNCKLKYNCNILEALKFAEQKLAIMYCYALQVPYSVKVSVKFIF